MQKSGAMYNLRQWVQKNSLMLTTLENLVRLSLWHPGRFGGSELAHEACHAAVGLLSVFHSQLLKEPTAKTEKSSSGISISRRSIHDASSHWLELIEQLETLIELGGIYHETTQPKSAPGTSRFNFLAVLEAIKAMLKLRMWRMQSDGEQTFLRDPSDTDFDRLESHRGMKDVNESMKRLREKRFKLLESTEDQGASQKWGQAYALASFADRFYRSASRSAAAAHEGLERSLIVLIASLSSPSTALDLAGNCGSLIGTVLHTLSLSPAASLPSLPLLIQARRSTQMKDLGMDSLFLSDLMHILRPFLYTLLLRKFGRHSRKPWLVSLAIDLWSMRLRSSGRAALESLVSVSHASSPLASIYQPTHSQLHVYSGQASSSSSLLSLALTRGLSDRLATSLGEHQEMEARKAKLLLYFLRPPFVDSFVKTPLNWMAQKTGLSKAPLISSLFEYGLDLLATTTDYYTYTAGS